MDVLNQFQTFAQDPVNMVDPGGSIRQIGGQSGTGYQGFANGLDLNGQGATDRAVDAQAQATREANQVQRYMYDTTRADQQPWRAAGERALPQLENPEFQRSFGASDFQADPGYQFRMSEGQKAIERSASARGGSNSGATMKALTRFGQDTASGEYQNAYNRFTNDQTNRFNRLSSIAGVGQTANASIGAAGQNYANQVGQNVTNQGNAVASANIAQANRQSQLMGQGIGAGAMMFSDERLKSNIQEISSEEMAELKQTIRAFKFNYKNEAHGAGDWMGVMAQDLEKSKLGKTLVIDDENGLKQLNIPKVLSMFLATLAEG